MQKAWRKQACATTIVSCPASTLLFATGVRSWTLPGRSRKEGEEGGGGDGDDEIAGAGVIADGVLYALALYLYLVCTRHTGLVFGSMSKIMLALTSDVYTSACVIQMK